MATCRGYPTPPIHRDMIDSDPAFGQQLFNVSVRQCVPEIPADCHDDHIRREPESRERGPRRTYPTRATRHQLTLPCPSSLDATEPMMPWDWIGIVMIRSDTR